MKVCKRGHEKPPGDCQVCKRERHAAWREKNRDRWREIVRKAERKHRGMTDVPAEPGLETPCEVCGRPTKPFADHDHATSKFRGWVCSRCNLGLGFVETPGWLVSAQAYLARRTTP